MTQKRKKKVVCLKIILEQPTNKKADWKTYVRLALVGMMIPVVTVEELNQSSRQKEIV